MLPSATAAPKIHSTPPFSCLAIVGKRETSLNETQNPWHATQLRLDTRPGQIVGWRWLQYVTIFDDRQFLHTIESSSSLFSEGKF